jgi:hypothetical protein
MATEQEKLIAKGMQEPTAGIAQQGEYSVGLFDLFKKDLGEHGFPETKGAAMREQLSVMKEGQGTQKQSWSEAHAKTRAEVIAIDNAKAFAAKLWSALPMALRDGTAGLPRWRGGTTRGNGARRPSTSRR